MSTQQSIAMWSGPRNISTAMMRAWENRPDTYVQDEPLYAHYLQQTGIDHPGAAKIIAAYECDWRRVVEQLTGPIPHNKAIYYQKHMTHHMLDDMQRDWMLKLTNCFLIREPSQVVVSLAKVLPNPTLEQTGFVMQAELFEYVRQHIGIIPPVIDTSDVLRDPRGVLSKLCAVLDIPFTEAMLNWPAGKRETDGNWGPYWYASVEKSTGFMPYTPDTAPVPEHLQSLVAACEPYYQQLAQHRLSS